MNNICFSRSFFCIVVALATLRVLAQQPQSPEAARAKISNGVAYSNLYPSSDFATRINDCISDAETGVASSHICDSTGEDTKQAIRHQIDIGNKSNAWVTWIHGANCLWTINMTGGQDYAFFQYGNTRVYGANQLRSGCQVVNGSANGGLAGFYNNNGAGYYQFGDFYFREASGTLTGKGVVQIYGAYDNSYYHDMTILNYVPGSIGLFIGGKGPCCSLMFERMSIGGNDTGGSMVDIEGSGPAEVPGVWFFNSSFGHPGKGKPIFICHDPGKPNATAVGFFGLYEEVTGDLAEGPINQVNGCVSVFAHGVTIQGVRRQASTPIAGWSFTNTFPTAINISNMTMNHGFMVPNIAIVTPSGKTIYTDDQGGLSNYTSNIDYADSIGLPVTTPSDNAACTPGTILGSDANYIYVCTASGTVKRATLSSY